MTNRHRHDPNADISGSKVRSFAQLAFRDRSIPSKIVRCPTCEADIEEPCRSASGTTSPHGSRRRMAIRALNEDYLVADCEYATNLGPGMRKLIRQSMGWSQAQLAREVGADRTKLRYWEGAYTTMTGADGARYGIWLRNNKAEAEERARALREKLREEAIHYGG